MIDNPYSHASIKRSAWQFLSGKVASGLLTFLILFLLVKILPVTEYGAYVTLVAGIELGYGLSDFGLPWLATRYFPDYRLHASGKQLKMLCIRFMFITAISLLVIVLIFVIFLDYYLGWIGLDNYRIVAQIYLGLFVVEGLGRMVRDSLMEPLMMQDEARKSMVMRQFSFVVLIVLLDFTGNAILTNVAWAEMMAVFISLIISLILMRRYLANLRDHPGQLGWLEPRKVTLWHMAVRMYGANLLTLVCSPQVFINLIQRVLGMEAAALFGFLSNLQGQIIRYLPTSIFFSIIRPKLVASYVGGGGMVELNRNASLAGKFGLFVLMPLVVMVALTGDPLVAQLSDGKFMGSGWLFLCFTLILVPLSQRQLLEAVAVASGHAGLCTWAAASGLITLPLIWVLLDWGLGLWAAVIAIGLGYLLFNSILIVGISTLAGYRIGWVGFLKLAISALAAYAASIWLPLDGIPDNWRSPWMAMMVRCILAVLVYLSFAWWVKPFTSGERDLINTLAKRRVFVW